MSKVEEAVELFKNGHACSQAILAAYGQPFGIDRETALKVSAGFAGGMGMGATCGAVAGAVMVIGLKYCQVSGDKQDRAVAGAKAAEFLRRFRACHSIVDCSALLGFDMGTSEGKAQARQAGVFKTRCPQFVRTAAEILEELL